MLEQLSRLFGSHIGLVHLGSFSNPIVAHIVEKFNVVLLSIGMIIIAYTSLISTVNTAQDGQIMGTKLSSIWIPIRSISGLFLMAPMPGSGYSVIQAFAIWIIIQGCAIANQTWAVVVDYLEQGISISKAIELHPGQKHKLLKQGENVSWQLLNSAICMASIQRIAHGDAVDSNQDEIPASQFISQYGKFVRSYQVAPIKVAATPSGVEYKGYFNIGIKQSAEPDLVITDYAEICGSYKVTGNVSVAEVGGSKKYANRYAKDATYKKLIALSATFNSLRPLAEKIVALEYSSSDIEAYLPTIKEYVKTSSNIYLDIVSEAIKPRIINKADLNIQSIEQLKQSDWTVIPISANLDNAKQIELFKTAVEDPPTTTLLLGTSISTIPSCNNEILHGNSDINATELGYLRKYISTVDETDYLCRRLTIVDNAHNHEHSVYSAESNTIASVANKNRHRILETTQKLINDAFYRLKHETNSSIIGNPIISQISFGNMLISTAEDQLLELGLVQMNLATIIPLIIWFCGAILVFFIPLVPCIMYICAVIGWFLLVIENLFVLPIIALGLIMPSNDEIGSAAKNLTLPLNTVIRPVLMVITFILAMRLYQVAMELVNFMMINMITTNFMHSSLLSPVIAISIYVMIILIMVNICFSLPYKIPNKVAVAIENSIPIAQASTAVVKQLLQGNNGGVLSSADNASAALSAKSNNRKIDPTGIT